MTTLKGLFKKLFTLNGLLKVMLAVFVLNMTNIGRSLLSNLMDYFNRGIKGMGKF